MERPQARKTELERVKLKLEEANALIKKLSRILESREKENHELRQMIRQREKFGRLPVSRGGNA
jgi:mannitol/fructose-specific phosphotransferase system IIA component (Ntr-type)